MALNELLTTFADNLLPILLISGAGFLLGKLLTIDARSLGRIVFYIFNPLLVFDLLLKTNPDSADILKTRGFVIMLTAVTGLQGVARQGNIVEGSMPAAVTTTVLATEYGLDTSLVTAIVFVGTILSPLTLTPLLVFLRR
jgi:predicted permease